MGIVTATVHMYGSRIMTARQDGAECQSAGPALASALPGDYVCCYAVPSEAVHPLSELLLSLARPEA